jgi:GNAT superfamily N-acetyltransferase
LTTGLEGLFRLTVKQVPETAEMMARAFADYPLTAFFHPDGAHRKPAIARGYRALLRFGVRYGEVYALSPRLEGAAMWLYSWNAKRTLWRSIMSGNYYVLVPAILRGQSHIRQYTNYTVAVHQRRAPFPHMYLQLLGVDPAGQGKGYSARLLRPMFRRTDGEGLPCYLETQAEKNVAIYRHFGFNVVEEGVVPGSDVRSWAMLREAGGK